MSYKHPLVLWLKHACRTTQWSVVASKPVFPRMFSAQGYSTVLPQECVVAFLINDVSLASQLTHHRGQLISFPSAVTEALGTIS